MRITAYTDSSTSEGFAVATCVILTNTTYVCSSVEKYNSVDSSVQAELFAIIQAARTLKEIDVRDHAIIKTDAKSLVKRGNEILKYKCVEKDVLLEDLWWEFLEVCEGLSIELKFMFGHSEDANPNKVCDRLSRALSTTLARC